MAGFEDLLRSALAKQDHSSATVRQRIYQSSRDALERMIQQRGDMSAETIALQRQQLEAAIVDVELSMAAPPPPPPSAGSNPGVPPTQPVSEGLTQQPAPAAPPAQQPTPSAPQVQNNARPMGLQSQPPASPSPVAPEIKSAGGVQPSASESNSPRVEPVVSSANRATPPAQSPSVAVPRSEAGPYSADGRVPSIPQAAPSAEELSGYPSDDRDFDGNPIVERKPYAKMLFWAIILCGLGVSIWWLVSFGPDLLKSRLDGSVPNPRPVIESSGNGSAASEGWLAVFSPQSNAENIITGNEGQVQLIQSGERTFARINSNPGTDNRIRLVVPAGIMEQIKGRAATFEMTMQSVDGEQQFSVYCEFKAMGNCGRQRFQINGRLQPFIFDILVNDETLPSGENAYIAINTDLGGTGKAIDLGAIRVRIDR